jgi:hypothetical protein
VCGEKDLGSATHIPPDFNFFLPHPINKDMDRRRARSSEEEEEEFPRTQRLREDGDGQTAWPYRQPYDYFNPRYNHGICQDFGLPAMVEVGDVLITKTSVMGIVLSYHDDGAFTMALAAAFRDDPSRMETMIASIPVSQISRKCSAKAMRQEEIEECLRLAFQYFQIDTGVIRSQVSPIHAIHTLRTSVQDQQRTTQWTLNS